ncbi:MAG: hypothetical protein RL689_593, partial [Planctomycetota bacterium]
APGSISACPSIPSTLSVQGEFRPTTTFRWQWRSRVGGPWIDVAEGLNTPPDPIEGPEFVATGVASRTVGLTLREAGSDPASSWTFRCLLDGSCGVIETAPAVLAANPASTRIVGQPIASIVAAGQDAAFTCAAAGTALTYQWRRNGTALINGPNYGGGNSPTLLVRQVGASDEGTYDCLVSGSCGVVASSSVSLTCRPHFGVHPAGGGLCRSGFRHAHCGTAQSGQLDVPMASQRHSPGQLSQVRRGRHDQPDHRDRRSERFGSLLARGHQPVRHDRLRSGRRGGRVPCRLQRRRRRRRRRHRHVLRLVGGGAIVRRHQPRRRHRRVGRVVLL